MLRNEVFSSAALVEHSHYHNALGANTFEFQKFEPSDTVSVVYKGIHLDDRHLLKPPVFPYVDNLENSDPIP
jgi:hypothetical protein